MRTELLLPRLSPDLFEVTFEKTESPEDADYFVLNPTTYALTVNQSKLPASSRYNKTCTVTPKIKVTTTATNEGQLVKVDYTGNSGTMIQRLETTSAKTR